MASGYISIYRQIQDHWLWKGEPFSRGQAWIDLLLTANHQDSKMYFNGKLIDVQRGEVITSEVKLSERWGWSRTKERNFLKTLSQEQMIVQKKDSKKTDLIISNYADYQTSLQVQKTVEKQQKNNRKTSEKHQKNTINNDNNDNNDNKYIPPIIPQKEKTFPSVEKLEDIVDKYTENQKLRDALKNFVRMREDLKKPLSERAINIILKKLDDLGNNEEHKTKIVDQSIECNWQTVYPLRKDNKGDYRDCEVYKDNGFDYDEMEKIMREKM